MHKSNDLYVIKISHSRWTQHLLVDLSLEPSLFHDLKSQQYLIVSNCAQVTQRYLSCSYYPTNLLNSIKYKGNLISFSLMQVLVSIMQAMPFNSFKAFIILLLIQRIFLKIPVSLRNLSQNELSHSLKKSNTNFS